MRNIFLIIIAIFTISPFIVLSQDTLYMINGEKKPGRILEIKTDTITYEIPNEAYNNLLNIKSKMQSWSLGIGIGAALPYGAISQYIFYPFFNDLSSRRGAFSIDANYRFNYILTLQGQVTGGSLYGSSNNVIPENTVYFNTEFYEYSLNALININNIFKTPVDREHPKLSFYLRAGFGLLKFRSVLYKSVNDSSVYRSSYGFNNDGLSKAALISSFIVPVGLGVNYRLSKRFDIKAEGVPRFSTTDKLDADNGSKKIDKYGITSVELAYKFGKGPVAKDRIVDKTDVYSIKSSNGKTQTTFKVDTIEGYYLAKISLNRQLLRFITHDVNKAIIVRTGRYREGEEYAIRTYHPYISTIGSVVAGLTGGYLAFYGILIPTAYTIGSSSASSGIRDDKGILLIPESRLDDRYFIQGYKDKARRIEVKNTIKGGITGFLIMVAIKSIHNKLIKANQTF